MKNYIMIYNIGYFSAKMHNIMVQHYGEDYHQSGVVAIECKSNGGKINAPTSMVLRSSYILGPSKTSYADFHKRKFTSNRSSDAICKEIMGGSIPLLRMEGIRNAISNHIAYETGKVEPLDVVRTLATFVRSNVADVWMSKCIPHLDVQLIDCTIDEYVMGTSKEESLLPIFEEAVHEKRREQATKNHIIEGDKYANCCRIAKHYMDENPVDIEMFSEEDLHAYLATFLLKVKPTTGDSNV